MCKINNLYYKVRRNWMETLSQQLRAIRVCVGKGIFLNANL